MRKGKIDRRHLASTFRCWPTSCMYMMAFVLLPVFILIGMGKGIKDVMVDWWLGVKDFHKYQSVQEYKAWEQLRPALHESLESKYRRLRILRQNKIVDK